MCTLRRVYTVDHPRAGRWYGKEVWCSEEWPTTWRVYHPDLGHRQMPSDWVKVELVWFRCGKGEVLE
jgi:hypothetical protein